MNQSRVHHRISVATVTAIALIAVAGCNGGSDERPNAATWTSVWESRQALIPEAEAILNGGADLCGERLGTLRIELPALRPTPSEVIDATVDEWAAHAETIMFECPSDPADLDDRLKTLDAFAAEVDAGLAASTG